MFENDAKGVKYEVCNTSYLLEFCFKGIITLNDYILLGVCF